MRGRRLQLGIVLTALVARPASAHELTIELVELTRSVERLERTLVGIDRQWVGRGGAGVDHHRRLLGAAEVDLAMGQHQAALEKLLGRIADPEFRSLPEYATTLAFASEILERTGEDTGALMMARLALRESRVPHEIAEAAERWLRLGRRLGRTADRLAVAREALGRAATELREGSELGQRLAYELAFAFVEARDVQAATSVLRGIPPDAPLGSRAAYLAATAMVVGGHLGPALRWYEAIADWPEPSSAKTEAELELEMSVRALASLSAARLRFERGDLALADRHYARAMAWPSLAKDACKERLHVALEQRRPKAALDHLRCVRDLGAGGRSHVEVELTEASLLAQLERFEEARRTYEAAEAKAARLEPILALTIAGLEDPAEFLFAGLERSAVDRGDGATPGPPVGFGEAWSRALDHGYSIDRGLRGVDEERAALLVELDRIEAELASAESFPDVRLRRRHLEALLHEVEHLSGHAGDLAISLGGLSDAGHALPRGALAPARVAARLAELERGLRARLERLSSDESTQRRRAEAILAELRRELAETGSAADELERAARGPITSEARRVLAGAVSALGDARKKAEYGWVETYWIAKEKLTERLRAKVVEQDEVKATYDEAERDLLDGM